MMLLISGCGSQSTNNQKVQANSQNSRSPINEPYKNGQLTKIVDIKQGTATGFTIDLINSGKPQNVEFQKGETSSKNKVIVKSSNGEELTVTYTGEMGTCYAAYLRNDYKPDLIFVFTGGAAGWCNDFFIIGGADNGKVLKFAGMDLIKHNGGRTTKPELSLAGSNLILSYKEEDITFNGPRNQRPFIDHKLSVVWNETEKKFTSSEVANSTAKNSPQNQDKYKLVSPSEIVFKDHFKDGRMMALIEKDEQGSLYLIKDKSGWADNKLCMLFMFKPVKNSKNVDRIFLRYVYDKRDGQIDIDVAQKIFVDESAELGPYPENIKLPTDSPLHSIIKYYSKK